MALAHSKAVPLTAPRLRDRTIRDNQDCFRDANTRDVPHARVQSKPRATVQRACGEKERRCERPCLRNVGKCGEHECPAGRTATNAAAESADSFRLGDLSFTHARTWRFLRRPVRRRHPRRLSVRRLLWRNPLAGADRAQQALAVGCEHWRPLSSLQGRPVRNRDCDRTGGASPSGHGSPAVEAETTTGPARRRAGRFKVRNGQQCAAVLAARLGPYDQPLREHGHSSLRTHGAANEGPDNRSPTIRQFSGSNSGISTGEPLNRARRALRFWQHSHVYGRRPTATAKSLRLTERLSRQSVRTSADRDGAGDKTADRRRVLARGRHFSSVLVPAGIFSTT